MDHLLGARSLFRTSLFASGVAALCIAPRSVAAQYTITVPTATISSGKPGLCTAEGSPPVLSAPSATSPAEPAKTDLKFRFTGEDKNPADLLVQIDGVGIGTIPQGSPKDFVVSVRADKLENGTISILRDDSEVTLCSLIPWVTPRTFRVMGPNFTSFVADGAIGKALRGGPASDVTGSLGIDHRSEATVGWSLPKSRRARFFHPFQFWRSKGEELHAILTVASSSDSLVGSAENFGSAILAPNLNGSGSIQGATIEYHSFNPLNKSGGTWGPRIKTTFARSMWRTIDTLSAASSSTGFKTDTLHQAIPLMAVDAGFRFAFLNHLLDEKGNTYAVGLDLNYVLRLASPNSDLDKKVVNHSLQSGSHRAAGVGTAFWIRLRQVTATAEIPYFWHPKEGPIQGLTGLQPTVTMRYSSALFTF